MIRSRKAAALAAAGVGAALLLKVRNSRRWMNLADRVVVITGGSRGLGLVVAREFAKAGARLVLLARDPQELERARVDVAKYGAEPIVILCDVRNRDEVEAAIGKVIETYQSLDVLINNAGVIQVGPLAHMSLQDFENAMAVHFSGPLYTMLAAIPHMRAAGGGRIVNISSIGGKIAIPHLAPYSASKFALVGLSDAMRAELAADGIRVTTVCPGLMRTGSHVNAQFKGKHKSEFGWFAIGNALPVSSISARSAARQILQACCAGASQLVISPQAKALCFANALFPGVTANATALVSRLLPGPSGEEGNALHTGWDSRSSASPSILTRLADRQTQRNNELPNDEK